MKADEILKRVKAVVVRLMMVRHEIATIDVHEEYIEATLMDGERIRVKWSILGENKENI